MVSVYSLINAKSIPCDSKGTLSFAFFKSAPFTVFLTADYI